MKRSWSDDDVLASPSPLGPPTKKAYRHHVRSSPLPERRYSKSLESPCSKHTFKTTYATPLDSPTNPFGIKRSLAALDLPSSMPLKKHFVLRLQLVYEHDKPAHRKHRGGVYRVVQIPRNYTFRHLHKLILFLFASDAHDDFTPSTRVGRSDIKGKQKATPDTEPVWHGHVFEIQNRIQMYRYHTKAGIIQAGRPIVKLSSVRERRLFRDLYDPSGSTSTNFDDSETEDDSSGCSWVGEDDYTLAHIWPEELTLDKGIIYRHSPSVSIHITQNTLEVEPPRKSSSNSPYVHLAQGFAGNAIQLAHTVLDQDGNEQTAEIKNITFEPCSRSDLSRWNAHRAFAAFLQREGERERGALRQYLPDELLDDIPVTLPTSSPTLGPSSEADFSEPETIPSSPLSASYFHSDPLPFPTVTPYPTHPLRRRRVERVGRRMTRLTKSGMAVLSSDEEDEKKPRKRLRKPSEEVLQWSDDDVGESDNEELGRRNDTGEDNECLSDWDPFGDEVEV